jgi:hypothetical protein
MVVPVTLMDVSSLKVSTALVTPKRQKTTAARVTPKRTGNTPDTPVTRRKLPVRESKVKEPRDPPRDETKPAESKKPKDSRSSRRKCTIGDELICVFDLEWNNLRQVTEVVHAVLNGRGEVVRALVTFVVQPANITAPTYLNNIPVSEMSAAQTLPVLTVAIGEICDGDYWVSSWNLECDLKVLFTGMIANNMETLLTPRKICILTLVRRLFKHATDLPVDFTLRELALHLKVHIPLSMTLHRAGGDVWLLSKVTPILIDKARTESTPSKR